MSLYEKFADEAAFRELFVKPLLNRLGFYGVSQQHGTQEFGKDFVFSELHRLGGMRHLAAQVKHEAKIHQGRAVDELFSQIKQAFATPFRRSDSPRDCHVSAVYVFNSGEITVNAKGQLLNELMRERFGDNVHFLDGERLHSLNEWATIQTDAHARTRLIGLRSALRAIVHMLRTETAEGKVGFAPLFTNGIELYLSEPVNADDELLSGLFKLWHQLQAIEALRGLVKPLTRGAGTVIDDVAPTLKQIAEMASPLALKACQKVDALLEAMEPIK